MASSLSKRNQGILSVLDDNNMKVGPMLRRSVSTADMCSDQTRTRTRRSDDHVNSWFAPKSSEAEEAPPYIHPLVKKSASSVSLKSLEACTESLGSESGSDGFSNLQQEDEEDLQVNTTTCTMQKTFTRRKKINKGNPKPSFPPPLSSLSYHHHHQDEQGRQPLRVRSHRDLGRLVIEATALPLHTNNFQAQRQHGRLLLAFTTDQEK